MNLKSYTKNSVPLNHHDPFTLLIAVLLSAQCTDERVNKITPILFKKANNPFDMIKLSVEEIKTIIRPCGLSPKNQRHFDLSHILIAKYNGEVPKEITLLEELLELVQNSFGSSKSSFWTSSISSRYPHSSLNVQVGFTSGKNVVQTEKDAKRLFPENIWNKLHLQIFFM